MNGPCFRAVGVDVWFSKEDQGWAASVDFVDDGFADDVAEGWICTKGVVRTKFFVEGGEIGLASAIDTVIADARRMGVVFRETDHGADSIRLYYAGERELYSGDGAEQKRRRDWRAILKRESARRGWPNPKR